LDTALTEEFPYQATSSIDARHFEANIAVRLFLVDRFNEVIGYYDKRQGATVP
jgi:hypothetical protein